MFYAAVHSANILRDISAVQILRSNLIFLFRYFAWLVGDARKLTFPSACRVSTLNLRVCMCVRMGVYVPGPYLLHYLGCMLIHVHARNMMKLLPTYHEILDGAMKHCRET